MNAVLDQNLQIEAAPTPRAYNGPIGPALQIATGLTQEYYTGLYAPPSQSGALPMQETYTHPDGTIPLHFTAEIIGQPYVTPYMPLDLEVGQGHDHQGYNEGYGNTPQLEAGPEQQAFMNSYGDYNRVDAPAPQAEVDHT